ncbi:hypothetical protein [Cryobacterium sp. PAMC25264]|uniref:hypothetical protein n=1 Tax=Cryobacterium sp. PAMC25264 TaxID=2861288 RepID=UPI001C633801|nr:hypothetical protein [Cryobacterium sp. PAMC25264]QYF73805.1 hypothetical protein KY500_00535 [Cryobacterium sp. PAMC25264]
MSSPSIPPHGQRPSALSGAVLRTLWAAALLAGGAGGTLLAADELASAAPGTAEQDPASAAQGTASSGPGAASAQQARDSTDALALLPLGGGVAALGTASVVVFRRLNLSDD